MLQEHLISFHKMSREAATGIVIRRNLMERITTTRGPILCKTCSDPVTQEEMTQPFHQDHPGFQFVLVINVLVLSDLGTVAANVSKEIIMLKSRNLRITTCEFRAIVCHVTPRGIAIPWPLVL